MKQVTLTLGLYLLHSSVYDYCHCIQCVFTKYLTNDAWTFSRLHWCYKERNKTSSHSRTPSKTFPISCNKLKHFIFRQYQSNLRRDQSAQLNSNGSDNVHNFSTELNSLKFAVLSSFTFMTFHLISYPIYLFSSYCALCGRVFIFSIFKEIDRERNNHLMCQRKNVIIFLISLCYSAAKNAFTVVTDEVTDGL